MPMAVSTRVLLDPGANSTIHALAVQADGKTLVGAASTTLGGGGTGTTTRNYIGRLHADGSLDTSFDPGANSHVCALAVQADGKILVGSFSPAWEVEAQARPHATISAGSIPMAVSTRASIRGPMALSGPLRCRRMARFWSGASSRPWEAEAQARPHATIGRLNADGSLDTSFDPGCSGTINTLAVEADGKILVGGRFSTLGGGGTGTTTRNGIGRLNADGSLDTSFDPGVNDWVNVLAVQADGKILVGGRFAQPWAVGAQA